MISRERLLKVVFASGMFLFASISANADDLIRSERCIDTRKEPKPSVELTISEMKAEAIVEKEITKADKYEEAGNLDEALRAYSFALLLSKDDFQKNKIHIHRGHAIFNKASLLMSKQEFKTAIEILNKGLSLDDTDDHEKYLYLSQSADNYKALDQYDMAMDDINRAMLVATCSEKTELYEKICDVLIQKEQYANAIQYCNAIISSPDARQAFIELAYYDRAVAYMNLKQYEKALKDINKALVTAKNPLQALCYNTRGMVYVNMNQHENAMKDYQKACDLGITPACRELKNK